jgi:hypothetical protein
MTKNKKRRGKMADPAGRTEGGIKVFMSYAHEDEELRNQLDEHLGALKNEGIINVWWDGEIPPGSDWDKEIAKNLETADLILLLVSSAFLNSTYSYEKEMHQAVERHEADAARVIPIIVRDCDWQKAPFAKLQGLPKGMKPVTSWPEGERDAVWSEIAKKIRLIATKDAKRPPSLAGRNRRWMLELVRKNWIDGYLKHSLHDFVRIELGLEERPGAVIRPWDLTVQFPDQAPHPVPAEQLVSEIFDELGGKLLILGGPGAGKTTLLLELTRDLLERAEQDASYPMPVVFHLSSWAVRRRPLADWLVDEPAERYYMPRKLGQAWTDAEQLLPLLDGLDEVAPEHRPECVEAINIFRRQHRQVPLAVCSRAADYQALSVRVELSGAIVIQPLSRPQVSTYLKQAGKPLTGVRTALRGSYGGIWVTRSSGGAV